VPDADADDVRVSDAADHRAKLQDPHTAAQAHVLEAETSRPAVARDVRAPSQAWAGSEGAVALDELATRVVAAEIDPYAAADQLVEGVTAS